MHRRLAVFGVGLVSLSVLFPATTNAVDVYTDPVGFITLNIKGTNGLTAGTSSALSYLGLGMTQLVVKPGRITSVATNELVDANASWSDDQYNGANGPHFIEITSGPLAGTIDDIVKTVAATKKIYTANDLASLGVGNISNQTYRIRKHWTLGSLFGPANEAGLLGGGSAATADNVLTFDPLSQKFTTYYYKNTGFGGTGWRVSTNAGTDASGTILDIDRGFIVKRRTGSDLSLKLLGQVKLGQTYIPIETNNNITANVYASNLTLTNSQLYTGNSATGLTGGGSAASADNVLIFDVASQKYVTYYYKTGGFGGTGWRTSTNASVDVGSVPLPLGQSFLIKRKQVATPFEWVAPQPFPTP